MKNHKGRVIRRRKHFARLYDDNDEWPSNHANDLRVFNYVFTIVRRTKEHPLQVFERLAANPIWGPRLAGKSLASWRDCYNRWKRSMRQKLDKVQAKKIAFDP